MTITYLRAEVQRLRTALELIVRNDEDYAPGQRHLVLAQAALDGKDPEAEWRRVAAEAPKRRPRDFP